MRPASLFSPPAGSRVAAARICLSDGSRESDPYPMITMVVEDLHLYADLVSDRQIRLAARIAADNNIDLDVDPALQARVSHALCGNHLIPEPKRDYYAVTCCGGPISARLSAKTSHAATDEFNAAGRRGKAAWLDEPRLDVESDLGIAASRGTALADFEAAMQEKGGWRVADMGPVSDLLSPGAVWSIWSFPQQSKPVQLQSGETQ